MRSILAFFVLITLVSCTSREPVKPEEPPLAPTKTKAPFIGKWEGGKSHGFVFIAEDEGFIVGRNGAEIPISITYAESNILLIVEEKETSEFYANSMPMEVAKQLPGKAPKSYYVMRLEPGGKLAGIKHSFQVFWKKEDFKIISMDTNYVRYEEWIKVQK